MSILAEAIVSYTVEKIGDLAIEEFILSHGVRGAVDSIKSELRTTQAFLRDADAKGKQGDAVAKNWVVEVREASCDAEDAVEMFSLRAELKRRRGLATKCIYFFIDLYHLHQIGTKIKEIKARISDIHSRRNAYREVITNEGERTSPHGKLIEYRKNAAVAEDEDAVGLEGDANTLVARLTRGDKDRRVVSIVAMGGAGKTTLANKVYRRQDVENHFGSCIAWVCVSQNYDVKELLQDIAKQAMHMSKQEAVGLGVRDLRRRLSQFLALQRYLIVLDDIWENYAWDQLEAAFPKGMNGSRIMLTTRNKALALRFDLEPHELRLLKEEESWMLFLKKAFPGENGVMCCPQELVDVGKQIVAKCGGLPLAIKVIGGLIAEKNRTRQSWLNVLNSLPQQLSKDGVHCSDILALSYDDLPYDLKPCFLYFGLFPEDHEISAKKLIRLWVAEGFIQHPGQQTLEDAAEDRLEELINRSMVQAERGYDRLVRKCRVHDLLHNLAVQEGGKNRFLEIDRNLNDSTSIVVRRLAIHDYRDYQYDSLGRSVLKVRSLLCFTQTDALHKLPSGAAKFLRVLDLEFAHVNGKMLFNAMGAINHLKYLSLTRDVLQSIPPSIAKLYKLETLLLREALRKPPMRPLSRQISLRPPMKIRVNPEELSEAIGNMNQLRHLVATGCKFPRLGHLKILQTIALTAGEWIKEDSFSGLTSLRTLKVRGILCSHGDMLLRSIAKLVNIQSLVLKNKHWTLGPQCITALPLMSFKEHVLLDRLALKGQLTKLLDIHEFPPILTKLTLEESLLEEDPMPTLEKLQNLQILKLRYKAYVGENMITSSQGFPKLRYLELADLCELKGWTVEKGGMPTLECLLIDRCRKLTMLPHGLRNVSTLRKLNISRMAEEFYGRLQENEGEDWDKIKHIPTIHVRKW